MAWTSPRTWVAGELVTASLMNTYVRDDFSYLKDSPTFDGNVSITGTLGVTGLTTIAALSATTGTFSSTLSPTALVDISGASAGQIKFPGTQNPSANVNTLDDYEEGTWTPVIGGSGGTSGQAYTTQVGSYIKVGKLVTASFRVTLSTLGTVTTAAQIQGLPFTSQNTTNMIAVCAIGRWVNFTATIVALAGTMEPNTTAIDLWTSTAATASLTTVVQGDLSNATTIEGTIAYRASA